MDINRITYIGTFPDGRRCVDFSSRAAVLEFFAIGEEIHRIVSDRIYRGETFGGEQQLVGYVYKNPGDDWHCIFTATRDQDQYLDEIEVARMVTCGN